MYQSFEETSAPQYAAKRVTALRQELKNLGLDGFLVPRGDEHQGEYVPPCAQRLAWLTSFTGSAGFAIIFHDSATIFTDGRYKLQVRAETDAALFSYEDIAQTKFIHWLAERAAGRTIGFDPWLHTMGDIANLRKALAAKGGVLRAIEENPIDKIWDDQPAPPLTPVSIHPIAYAGQKAEDKLAILRADLQEAQVDYTILTDPSSIAWVFNIRGQDVPRTPLPLSFAIISQEGPAHLFIDPRKLSEEISTYLQPYCVVHPPKALLSFIAEEAQSKKTFGLDPTLCNERLYMAVINHGGMVVEMRDPARLPRAIKNPIEREGARQAHLRDGIALIRFFAWLDAQPAGRVTEISAAQALETFREEIAKKMGEPLLDLSFDTISGAGPNGAIIHYRTSTKTNKTLTAGMLYLVDSGAQYRDGTTDVTRTIAIGKVGAEEKQCFTQVLKGIIALSCARFPLGTRGVDLDVLARNALWKAGRDYAHGTGHGVGSYLSVHEGPQNISSRGMQELKAGMILSNEPGYYRDGAFGIRIENLVLVHEQQTIEGGDLAMLGFETLTLCPIDKQLIAVELLTQEERSWVNAYHADIYKRTYTYLNVDEQAWLKKATTAL